MEDKTTNIKERILYIADLKGVSKEKFFEELGLSYGNFKGKSKNTPINSNALADISAKYPEINIEWLVLGRGGVYKSVTNESIGSANEQIIDYGQDWKGQYERLASKYTKLLEKHNLLLENKLSELISQNKSLSS